MLPGERLRRNKVPQGLSWLANAERTEYGMRLYGMRLYGMRHYGMRLRLTYPYDWSAGSRQILEVEAILHAGAAKVRWHARITNSLHN